MNYIASKQKSDILIGCVQSHLHRKLCIAVSMNVYYLCPPCHIQNMNHVEIQCGKSHDNASLKSGTHKTSNTKNAKKPRSDIARGSGQQCFISKSEGEWSQ